MHADVLNHLTLRRGNTVTTKPTFSNPYRFSSHHINHYSEAARILTTGPRQNATRHADSRLFYPAPQHNGSHLDYTHYARKIANNTELRRLPRGYSTSDTHPYAECIGLFLHGHLIITWSLIARTATNQTTMVHYYFDHNYTLTTTTNARLNRFGPSTTRTHRNAGQLWITNNLGSFRVKSDVLCVDIIDYHSEVN